MTGGDVPPRMGEILGIGPLASGRGDTSVASREGLLGGDDPANGGNHYGPNLSEH